jgi:hypothetical protein
VVRARAMAPLLLLVTALVSGCSADAPAHSTPTAGAARGTPAATPTLGGATPQRRQPPRTAMNALERPVAQRLGAQIAGQGLTLQYLDCPHWDSRVPSRMTCQAYVDGLVASVLVRLRGVVAGKAVSFDAELGPGVVATRNLEQTLRAHGWTGADCGDVPAYPARVGDRIVCRVERPGVRRYVAATITGRSGAVTITDYRGGRASR